MFTGLDTKVLTIKEVLPQEGSLTLVVRVKNPKIWAHILKDILRFNEDGADFGAAVQKEYYIESGKFFFAWKVILWGDLEEAQEDVLEVLKREPELKVARRPAPPETPPLSHIRREVINRGDHREVRSYVTLPHGRKASDRNEKREGTKKIGSKGRGAFAHGIGDGND